MWSERVTELPRDETTRERWIRRAITIPGFALAGVLTTAALPLALPLVAAYDALSRNRWSGTRSLLGLVHYFLCEAVGLIASGLLAVAGAFAPERALEWNFRLQCLWARALFAGARRLFGLKLTVAGLGSVAAGPALLLMRHASVVDTLLPAVVVSSRTGLRLRYVMKRELLWDPCLDVVGQRLPNAFVRRGQGGSPQEIARVRDLARDLGPRDGVLLYPEGTRFTPRKRSAALARLAETADPKLVERARSLQHLLPPRLGGVLALLETAPGTDVVFCAHTGLEGLRTLNDLWNGALVGRSVEVEFWRVPAASIPTGLDARVAWIYDQWSRVDAWLDARAPHGGTIG